jgi:prefoldin subunit 5
MSFADALEERKELVSTIAQLEIMAQKVEELNDAKGVRAIRDRITGFQADLDELEENLAEVRQALARL